MGSYIIMDGASPFTSGDGLLGLAPEGMVAVEVPFPARDWTVTLAEDGDYTIAPRPVPIEELQAAKWTLVKAARDRAETSGCMTPLGRVDTNAASKLKISGAVQMATILGAGFSMSFTMQDNSDVVHDAPAMIAMGLWVGAHVDACHQEGKRRRNLIYEAETVEDLDAIPISTGWP